MEIVVFSVAFVVAVLCAGVMGYAIQRGATCTVAAVDEVVAEGAFSRLLALVEAALWVAGGVVVAQALHVLPQMPAGYAITSWTLIGGALLGLGAAINGACVFGSIARFGSGEWAYLLTPLGFFLGCVSVGAVFGAVMPHRLEVEPPVLRASTWLVLPFAALALWRVALGARALLAVALLAGAVLGGWTAGRMSNASVDPVQLVRCVVGGVVMGWGSVLLPGGNDGLVLVAMPLGWPYAWLAFATMCATIATARIATGHWRPDAEDA